MAARGEEFAQKIEQSIREAVERMVADIRSSIDDVREAVNQQLDAASQSVQADAKSLALRSHIDDILAGEPDEEPAVETPAPRSSAASLKNAIRAIEQGKSQVEVLNSLLEQTLQFSSRSALFILKGGSFAGWKGAGFSAHGGNDDQVKRFTGGPSDVPELRRLLDDQQVVDWDGGSIASRLGASTPQRAALIPMVIKDKVAAAVYADVVEGAEEQLDRAAIELLVFTTGLLIDTLAIRKMIPSPTLTGRDEDEAETPSEAPTAVPSPVAAAPQPRPEPVAQPRPEPVAPPRPQPVPPPTPAPPARPTPPAEPERVAATTFESPSPARSFELEPEPHSAAPRVPPSPPVHPAPPPVQPAAPPPPRPQTPAAPTTQVRPPAGTSPGTSQTPEGDKPSTQYIPPPGVTGGRFGAQQAQSPEAKKHDEAKRFARLLVSEIKLYNEGKVDEGRKHRDLYERMKEDIDRSRQMYEERIGEDVRRQSNYFYDELVRILADGNPDLLGL